MRNGTLEKVERAGQWAGDRQHHTIVAEARARGRNIGDTKVLFRNLQVDDARAFPVTVAGDDVLVQVVWNEGKTR